MNHNENEENVGRTEGTDRKTRETQRWQQKNTSNNVTTVLVI